MRNIDMLKIIFKLQMVFKPNLFGNGTELPLIKMNLSSI